MLHTYNIEMMRKKHIIYCKFSPNRIMSPLFERNWIGLCLTNFFYNLIVKNDNPDTIIPNTEDEYIWKIWKICKTNLA